MIYIFISIAILYFILIFIFIVGEIKTEIYENCDVSNSTFVSIIISVRNEEKNIPTLINSLKKQVYPISLFEVIFVDDHSQDNTNEVIKNNLAENFKLISLSENESGKKQAINKAISIANGDIIATTDGDCYMKENWLSNIVSFYERNNSDMIIAPVIFNKKNNLLSSFQFYDFLSLISSTIGSSGIKRPIMCNGANLIYKKSVFESIKNVMNDNIPSGDDMFLLINLKKLKKKIDFLNSEEAIIYTNPKSSLKDFINQRIRWASKNTKHSDFDIYSTAIIVYFFNVSILILALLSINNFEYFTYLFQILIVKTFIEFLLISISAKTFKQKIKFFSFFTIQPLHIIYMTFIPLLNLVISPKWKGR